MSREWQARQCGQDGKRGRWLWPLGLSWVLLRAPIIPWVYLLTLPWPWPLCMDFGFLPAQRPACEVPLLGL